MYVYNQSWTTWTEIETNEWKREENFDTDDVPGAIVTAPRGRGPPVLKRSASESTRRRGESVVYAVELSISEAKHFSESVQPTVKKSVKS